MRIVMLIGAVVNGIGGVSMLCSMFSEIPLSFRKLPSINEIRPDDYVFFRLFSAGTAFCFGALYLYLYLHPQYAFPFLIFGMALKYWAFVASLIAYIRFRLPAHLFVGVGCVNLAVAVMFSGYLLL